MWAPQLQSLSKEFRCIAPDLWDHGNSAHLNEKIDSIEQLANDYWNLMQQLQIEEFAVVGLSVGGMWAAHLALKYPKAVKALVLMDTFLGSEPQATKQKYFALLDLVEKQKGFTDPILNQVVPLFFSPFTLLHKKHLADAFRSHLASIKPENIPGIVALGRTIFSRENILDQFKNISQPALVIVGRDDLPRPPKEAEEMASLLPNAELHVIEQAGHICNLEQPSAVSALLSTFLTAIFCEQQ